MAHFDPKTITLGNYRPGKVCVDCPRCDRKAAVDVGAMRRRFGLDITLQAMAHKIAADAGCQLAQGKRDVICTATAFEVPVEDWASLSNAWSGKWMGRLYCNRHMAAMKPTLPCPGFFDLDVVTLLAILGEHFKLGSVAGRCICPQCHTDHVRVEWHVPSDPTPPGGSIGKTAQILRMKPSRVQLAQQRFRAIEGGRGAIDPAADK